MVVNPQKDEYYDRLRKKILEDFIPFYHLV
jgi:hypothetical protein